MACWYSSLPWHALLSQHNCSSLIESSYSDVNGIGSHDWKPFGCKGKALHYRVLMPSKSGPHLIQPWSRLVQLWSTSGTAMVHMWYNHDHI